MESREAAELRRRVVEAGVTAFRAVGHASVGVGDVAREARLDVGTVQELFPSWDLLVIAVLDRWAGSRRREEVRVAETEGAVAYLRVLLVAAAADPALSRTRLAFIGAATDVHHPARGWYRAQYAQFIQDVALFFTRDILAKREPRTVKPRDAAGQLLALYEGWQVQATMLDGVDLVASWDLAVMRLRAGWSETPKD